MAESSAALTAPAPASASTRWARLRKHSLPYILVLPALAVASMTVLYPIIWATNLSMHKWIFYQPDDRPFLGLQNFITAIHDPIFLLSLRNTGFWVAVIVVFQLVLGFLIAILLNETFPGRGLVRALILIPWVTPTILSAFMWRWMYNINYGVINRFLTDIGLTERYIGFLSEPRFALLSVMVVVIWAGTPFFTLMLLAAMQAIPDELYEAAKVDGATSWQRMLKITVPMIAPTIAVTSLLRIIWVANSVDYVFIMTEGGPGYASMTLPVYVFLKARTALDMGYSSAMAIILALILIVIVMIYLNLMSRNEVDVR